MEIQRPFRTIAASVDGDVLNVLASAHAMFTVAQLSNMISDRSPVGLRNALARLTAQGIVIRHQIGNSSAYSLNTDHLAADAIRQIATSKSESGLAPGEEHVYSIESYDAGGIPADSRTWVIQTLTTQEVSARDVQPLTYQAGRSAAFHATFIADPTVPFTIFQNLGCGIFGEGYAFQGDDRGFPSPRAFTGMGPHARRRASKSTGWAATSSTGKA